MNFTAFAAATLLASTAAAADLSVPCVVESNTPDLAPEAETVGMLTCDALRRRGANVGAPTSAEVEGPAWRISLHRLGEDFVLRVARDGVDGQPLATEQLRIERLRDVEKAAPRLAEALTGGRSLKKSQAMHTVTAAESEHMQKKDGDFLWGVGVFGLGAVGGEASSGFGYSLSAQYETPDFGAVASLRGGGGEDVSLFEIGVGGRYFLSPENTSLFVGGGLSGLFLSVDSPNTYFAGEGLGAYAEVGVEFLRLYGSRLSVELRAIAPFFEADDSYGYGGACWEYECDDTGYVRSAYVLPVTIGATYSW